ncbi:MAG: poly(R)-hydroxyalkanoic acid synthase subunit PhaE [Dokdonella sp.]
MFDFTGNNGMPEWTKLAQQAMDAMKQASGVSGAGIPNPFASPWPSMAGANPMAGNPFAGMSNPFAAAPVNPFEAMTRSFAEASRTDGSSTNDVAERVAASMKNYFAMLQAMASSGMPPQAAGAAGDSNPWFDAMRTTTMPQGMDNPLLSAFRDFAGNGAQGFEQMANQFMSTPAMADARSLLQLPTFGMSRERQEETQQGILALLDFQEKSKQYQAQMMKAAQRGNQLFQTRMASRTDADKPIDTPRALYDFWVNAAEDGYAEVALSTEFSQAYGDYANAQMAVRSHVQKETERNAQQMGMPTRSEVDSIGRRLQELRREFRAANEAGDVAGLTREVASLRAEVKALREANTRLSREAETSSTKSDGIESEPKKFDPGLGSSLRGEVRGTRKPATKRASKRTPKASHRKSADHKAKSVRVKSDAGNKTANRSTKAAKPANSFAASIARFAEAAKTATRVESAPAGQSKKSGKTTKKRATKS